MIEPEEFARAKSESATASEFEERKSGEERRGP